MPIFNGHGFSYFPLRLLLDYPFTQLWWCNTSAATGIQYRKLYCNSTTTKNHVQTMNTHTHIKATLKYIDEPIKTLITPDYIKNRASILSNNCTVNYMSAYQQKKIKKTTSLDLTHRVPHPPNIALDMRTANFNSCSKGKILEKCNNKHITTIY